MVFLTFALMTGGLVWGQGYATYPDSYCTEKECSFQTPYYISGGCTCNFSTSTDRVKKCWPFESFQCEALFPAPKVLGSNGRCIENGNVCEWEFDKCNRTIEP